MFVWSGRAFGAAPVAVCAGGHGCGASCVRQRGLFDAIGAAATETAAVYIGAWQHQAVFALRLAKIHTVLAIHL
jgi:hypothetical protein